MKEFIKRHLISLILGFLLILSFIAIPLTGSLERQAGYGDGYGKGYTQGQSAGYEQGKQAGYIQGQTDGYNAGYGVEQNNWNEWLSQNCFTYPFLLLDISSYMACHR
jgi:hypothetical protein